MRTITLKNVPDSLYRRVRRSAAANRRSLNREIQARLDGSLEPAAMDAEAFIARVRAARKNLRIPPLTERFLRAAKNEGRA